MTSQISSLTSAVYKSRQILLEQMQAQDYGVGDYDGFSVNEVNTMKTNNQLDMILEKVNEDPTTKLKSKIYIRYYLAKALRPANLQEMIDDLFNVEEVLKKTDNLLIIMNDEPNETTVKTLRNIWEQDNVFIILFNINRLQYNVTEIALVPNHTVLSQKEADEVKIKYNIQEDSQIPGISRFDPVAQAIGMRPGDLCRIIRPSKTAVNTLFYRVCTA